MCPSSEWKVNKPVEEASNQPKNVCQSAENGAWVRRTRPHISCCDECIFPARFFSFSTELCSVGHELDTKHHVHVWKHIIIIDCATDVTIRCTRIVFLPRAMTLNALADADCVRNIFNGCCVRSTLSSCSASHFIRFACYSQLNSSRIKNDQFENAKKWRKKTIKFKITREHNRRTEIGRETMAKWMVILLDSLPRVCVNDHYTLPSSTCRARIYRKRIHT